MVFIDKMHFHYKKIDNGKVTQPESGKNELPFRFINTHSNLISPSLTPTNLILLAAQLLINLYYQCYSLKHGTKNGIRCPLR